MTSPKPGTVSFTCSDYPTAYQILHSILLEIYERDIENLGRQPSGGTRCLCTVQISTILQTDAGL